MKSQSKKTNILRLVFIFCTLLITGSCATARIDPVKSNHPPGSIGYIQDSCRDAIKNSTSFEEFNKTYCGDFLAGFNHGALAANWIIFSYGPNEECRAEKEVAANHIDSRFCKIFDKKKGLMLWIPEELYPATAFRYLNGWVAALEHSHPNQNILDTPITYANQLSYKTIDCNTLRAAIENQQEKPLDINSSLNGIDWKTLFKNKETISVGRPIYQESYSGCKKDMETTHLNPEKFKATRCGAEIIGYMTGLLTTDHLQYDYTPIEGNCKSVIDDLYQNISVAKDGCIHPDTAPARIAEQFILNTDRQLNNALQSSRNDKLENFMSQPVSIGLAATEGNVDWKTYMCSYTSEE